jgi:acetyl-CoA carboxylase carboxyl transferase subunit alpha
LKSQISELEAQTLKLKETHDKNKNLDISKELSQLEGKTEKLLHEIYDNLNAWQISQVSRHPQRPYTLDYIEKLFTDFEELHGDRAFADDPAIVGGLALFEGIPVMVIGHQKGRDVKERQHRNFGMPKPEGYRKALRLYKLAEKFNVPVVTSHRYPRSLSGY